VKTFVRATIQSARFPARNLSTNICQDFEGEEAGKNGKFEENEGGKKGKLPEIAFPGSHRT